MASAGKARNLKPVTRNLKPETTIVAPATPNGIGAISVVRLSGEAAIAIAAGVFRGSDLNAQPSHTAHVGLIVDDGRILDEVVVTLFMAPKTFTREDVVEISCHGSPVIVGEIVRLMVARGARLAEPGEFTKRAFLNGRIDLTQAEAVADLIAADTDNGRRVALNQMRGGFSRDLEALRQQLITFASLVELELDFSEEDVEFAKREELTRLIQKITSFMTPLIQSFREGNVIRNGVPTVIAGRPNAGKSTLLNVLLNEERAIVSEIPGTTRDTIEDEIILDGIAFRFIDTAGLRDTVDTIESMGVERTREKMKQAALILYLVDVSGTGIDDTDIEEAEVKKLGIPYIMIGNKIDRAGEKQMEVFRNRSMVMISAGSKTNIEALKKEIVGRFNVNEIKGGDVVITNLRHYTKLKEASESLTHVAEALQNNVTGEFLAQDIRVALNAMGEITGAITTDDLLGEIFSKFCIGK